MELPIKMPVDTIATAMPAIAVPMADNAINANVSEYQQQSHPQRGSKCTTIRWAII